MSDRQKHIGTWLIIILVCFVLAGNMYGLYHDFTEEYEASVPIQYDIIVYDNNGNEMIVNQGHEEKSRNYVIQNGKVITLTELDKEQLKIQEEQGCTPCHPK